MRRFLTHIVPLASALVLIATAHAGEPKWKQHTINGRSEFEAASAV